MTTITIEFLEENHPSNHFRKQFQNIQQKLSYIRFYNENSCKQTNNFPRIVLTIIHEHKYYKILFHMHFIG